MFPPEGSTTPRWPPRWPQRRGFATALHACDAFEAGPAAAWAAACAILDLAVEAMRTCPPENRPRGDAVRAAALRDRRDAILARRGPCGVILYTRTTTPADGAALSALVESQGGLFLGVGPDVGFASPREKVPRARDLPESQARLRSETPPL